MMGNVGGPGGRFRALEPLDFLMKMKYKEIMKEETMRTMVILISIVALGVVW